MANKLKVILDPHWRRLDELFSEDDMAALKSEFDVIWALDKPMPEADLLSALPDAFAYVGATPRFDRARLEAATALKAIVEVSGAFPDTVDYSVCSERGIEVLCCAPGFRQSVAEMSVAMALSVARGLVAEHELFRQGEEFWLDDRAGRDFTMFGATIGFIGYGQIAREIHRLLAPFGVEVLVYDPWLSHEAAEVAGVRSLPFDDVMAQTRCLFVTAVPTNENKGMVGADALARLPDGALVVLVSRAHLVDFDALMAAVSSGRIQAAIDVFPTEPLAKDHAARKMPGLILSPHRAAAVPGGRQLIGKLVLEDLRAMAAGDTPRALQRAANFDVSKLAGTGNAVEVADMAGQRS